MKRKALYSLMLTLIVSGCAQNGVKVGASNSASVSGDEGLASGAGIISVSKSNLEKMPSMTEEPISPYLIYSDNEVQKYFIPIKIHSRNSFPNLTVKSNARMVDYNLDSIMTVVTDASNMSFIIDADVADHQADKSFKLRGSLPEIMNQIARAFDVVYDINGNNIHIKKRTDFVVHIPPINDKAKKIIADALIEYGATDVRYDDPVTIHYTADFKAQEAISGYLNMIKETKSLVVYDLRIWDVEHDKDKAIDWGTYDKLVMKLKDATKTMRFNPSSKVTMMSNCRGDSAIDPTFIKDFLSTQGRVRFMHQPDLMMLSSTDETVYYTKPVDGTSVINSALNITGDYIGGMVRTTMRIKIGSKAIDSNGDKIDLTNDLVSKTNTSVYPGGTALITGIEEPNQNPNKRSELVVLIKPSVILLDKPTPGFFSFQEKQAERACRVEQRERENSVTFRKMLLDQESRKE